MGNVCGGPPKDQGRGKPVEVPAGSSATKKPAEVSQSNSTDTRSMGSK